MPHALQLGQLWAHDPQAVRKLCHAQSAAPLKPAALSPEALIADRAQRLVAYQDKAYAARYLASVEAVRRAEQQILPGGRRRRRSIA